MRLFKDFLHRTVTLAVVWVVCVLSVQSVFAAPYGAGSYGNCNFNENCTTPAQNPGSAAPDNSSTNSSGSDQDQSVSTDNNSATPVVKDINPAIGSQNLESNSEKTGNVQWWQYLSLVLAFILGFWWFIIARKRRKKDEKDQS